MDSSCPFKAGQLNVAFFYASLLWVIKGVMFLTLSLSLE